MALKIRAFISRLSTKQIVFTLIAFLSFVLFLILTAWSSYVQKGLVDQQMASRWDDEGGSAQVSCYFSEYVEIDEFTIVGFEKQLEKMLKEVLPAEDYSPENGKRLVVDAYSSTGTITISSEKGKLEKASAVGIGGDFFLFHPLTLVSGGYFSGNDLMKDFVILDEDAAWQLFGSNDISGQYVMIGNVPHIVAGVIKRQDGRFAESAGLNKSIVYVSNETLSAYGTSRGISTYEVVAPNPVKGYVYHAVKEKIGVDENSMIVVENSSRYTIESMIPIILDFGTRSMQDTAVKFPYWENIARGWEDIMALVLLVRILLLLVTLGIIITYLVIRLKNRKLTIKDVGNFFIDTKERIRQHAKDEKDKWEHF